MCMQYSEAIFVLFDMLILSKNLQIIKNSQNFVCTLEAVVDDTVLLSASGNVPSTGWSDI